MSDLAEVLNAGGLVPHDAKLDKSQAVDAVVARAYTHAALPGRTIVRLTAQATAAGDDLEMATLGFGTGTDRGVVAKERKRPLGFPGWALVNDPKNARFALDVVKELKKHARKAKSKPGHAKEGLDAIAAKLAKTVPHFLPSFYEEAGRAFIEHGAQSFAAGMFGKAREAEAVHALDIDEQHRVDGFLEFALAGAVTTKALMQYAKDLSDAREPAVAYAHFRQLCVQRTLGGMPPFAGMAKELRRLAKAAKLDVAAEDAKLIAEIIESPALSKSAAEFWRAYAEPITELAKTSTSARTAVLNLFPTGSRTQAKEIDELWLDLLDATGAVDALVGDVEDVKPNGGRAAWFDKLTAHVTRGWRDVMPVRVSSLLEAMAPALKRDGASITCAGRYSQIDLDLVDLALELGVAINVPGAHVRIDLGQWAKRASEPVTAGNERYVGRDPVRAAANEVLAPTLAMALDNEIGDEPFDTIAHGKQGFISAKRAWLDALVTRIETKGLPGVGEALATIQAKVKPGLFGEFPELYARFAAAPLAPALVRSLQVGIYDELGWPALDDATTEIIGGAAKPEFSLHGGLPALIVANATRLIAVGPSGRLGVHDLVLDPKQTFHTARFIGGQFLVVRQASWNKMSSYWSNAPHDAFEVEIYSGSVVKLAIKSAVLADGAWVEGKTTIRAGDRTLPVGNLASHDGTNAWTVEHKEGQSVQREISSTGELGRSSWPAFLEAGAADDWKIDGASSWVLPAPPGMTSSPLGMRDGLIGVRVRYQGVRGGVTAREIESIDGTKWSRTRTIDPIGLLHVPGADEARPVVEEYSYRETTIGSVIDPSGTVRGSRISREQRAYWRGSECVLPPQLWHALTPRDEAGSRALRGVDDATAEAMLAAIADRSAETLAATPAIDVVEARLPAVTHARLRLGVAGMLDIARSWVAMRDTLARDRDPNKAVARSTDGPADAVLAKGLDGWTSTTSHNDGERTWNEVERVATWFASSDRSDREESATRVSPIDWFPFASMPASLAHLALAIGTPDEARGPLVDLFALLAEKLPAPGQLRVFQTSSSKTLTATMLMRWSNGNAYVLRREGWRSDYRVLEYAPTGQFAVPDDISLTLGIRGVTSTAVDVTALRAAVQRGDRSWSDEAATTIAEATGMTRSEGALLWAGLPSIETSESNFLDKDLREKLGLKAAQAELARDALKKIARTTRIAVADTAARMGVPALLDGSAAATMANAIVELVGKRTPVPEDLIEEASKSISGRIDPGYALRLIAGDDTAAKLNVDPMCALDRDGTVIAVSNPEPLVGQTKIEPAPEAFDVATAQVLAVYLPFIYAELPVGHTLRARAVSAHQRGLQRLASPRLLLAETGSKYLDDNGKLETDKLFDAIGGTRVPGLAENVIATELPGAIVVRDARYLKLVLRPATLDVVAAPVIDKITAQITSWGTPVGAMVAYLRSTDLAAMMDRIVTTPVPAGGWEQDPVASVPKLVAAAAKKLGLSDDAAAVYLVYLVQLWPTAKNIAEWTGWRPKQIEAALDELVDKELLIAAKRERAQRGHFLPGGWEALKSPLAPLETWKASLYGTRTETGALVTPNRQLHATAPFHVLYERAWKRIEAGDVPKYDEVKR